VQVAQQQTFQAEISALKGKKRKKTISISSKIVDLSSIVDQNELLRVGGRLQIYILRQEARTQIILLYEQYHHQNS
jgi:hypothetical protein